MIIITRWQKNQVCAGCAKHGRTETRTGLCPWCFGIKMEIEDRRQKLTVTVSERFAYLKNKIQSQLKELSR